MDNIINHKTLLKSLAFKFIERITVKSLGLVISVILARLLAPEAFGQIAIITVFINLSQMILQSGLTTALVQNKDVEENDYSTVFYINFITAILLVLILYFASPFISQYYEDDSLTLPLQVYTLSLLFGAYNSVQMSKLQREMRFRPMMICSLIATILSGVLGVLFAYKDAGIWALIIYYLTNVIFTSLAMLCVDRWIPKLYFSLYRAKILFSYGWKMLISGILCSLYSDIRSLIIGKIYTTEDLAYYNRGQQIPNILSSTLDTSIQAVMFPAISALQDSREKMRELLKKSVTIGALLTLPAMVGLALISENFVTVLLTDKWLPAVPYLQVICIAEAHIPFSSSNLTAIKSTGRSDLYMKLEVVRRAVMLGILLTSVFCFHSINAIAIGYVISSWIDVIIIMLVEEKIVGYKLIEQLKDVRKIILSTAVMGVLTFLIGFLPFKNIVIMAIQIVVALSAYFACCFFMKEESFIYMLSTARKILNKSRSEND